jgi:hypothetical protein
MPGGQNLPYIYKFPEQYNSFDCVKPFVQTQQGYAGFEEKALNADIRRRICKGTAKINRTQFNTNMQKAKTVLNGMLASSYGSRGRKRNSRKQRKQRKQRKTRRSRV